MVTMRRVFILLFVVAASSLRADFPVRAPDNKGTDFFVAFPLNFSGTPALTLMIANEAAIDVKVELSAPGFFSEVNVAGSSVLSVPIVPQLQITAVNAVSDKGVRVRSVDAFDSTKEGAPIAVYALSQTCNAPASRMPPGCRPTDSLTGSAGAYVALPADVLSTEYRAATGLGVFSSAIGTQVTVVGTEENTTVTITAPVDVTISFVKIPAGTPFQVPLNELQAFLLQVTSGDLTGTLVTADKPVAVFSGNQNGSTGGQPDHIVEQMVPVNAWGNDFVVAPIVARNGAGYLVRVLAHQDGTDVEIDGAIKATLNAGQFHLHNQTTSSAISLRTSKPALVVQFNKSDASAMLVPPVNQFSRDYLFKTPGAAPPNSPFPNATGSNHLNIVVKNGDEAGLLLNNAQLPATTEWTLVEDYRYARVGIDSGTIYKLEHQEPTVRFGAWVYGHFITTIKMGFFIQQRFEGYGYAAGQLLNNLPLCADDHAHLSAQAQSRAYRGLANHGQGWRRCLDPHREDQRGAAVRVPAELLRPPVEDGELPDPAVPGGRSIVLEDAGPPQ
ncbi:MAG: IgGFc-binding protein [Acidobacteria bacterium]|nr:IgGFc-binding protein [Acidobacteriota bacterium]